MSSSKFIKIQSQQNGNFTASNNRVDFRIPASMGNVSLKDSFVQLYARTSSGVDETIPIMLEWTASPAIKFNNVSLIKDAHWTSANKGMVERCRRVDILRDNMLDITRSTTQVLSNSYMDASQFKPLNSGDQLSIFQQFSKEGAVSQDNADNVPIEIRCGDFLNSWNVNGVVPMDKMGDSTLHLELNLDKVRAVSNVEPVMADYVDSENRNFMDDVNNTTGAVLNVDTLTTKAVYSSIEAVPFYVGMAVNWIYINDQAGGGVREIKTGKITALTYGDDGKATITLNTSVAVADTKVLSGMKLLARGSGNVVDLVDDYQNTSGGDEDVDEVVLTPNYANVNDVPFKTGNLVKWSVVVAGAPIQHIQAEITNVVVNANKATITLDTAITIADQEILSEQYLTLIQSGTTANPVRVGDLNVEYYLAELVVKQENTSSPLKELIYNEFNTYELNGNNITNYNYTLEIEGRASTAIIMFPDASGLRSSLPSLTSWRLFLNDQNLTDRNEEQFSALSTERLIRTFDTLRMPVRCLNRANYLNNSSVLYDENNLQTIIFSPLFSTGNRKNLQMVIESGGLNQYVVFTSIPKSLAL